MKLQPRCSSGRRIAYQRLRASSSPTSTAPGSASANGLSCRRSSAWAFPVSGKNLFPSNIQGLPTWYEIRVNKDGHTARAPELRPDGRDERGDLRARRHGGARRAATSSTTRPGRSTTELRRDDVTFLGVPLAQMCNENFDEPRERILMKNIAYAGALAALLDIDMDVIDAAAGGEVRARRRRCSTSNHKALRARLRLRQAALRVPAADPLCRRWTRTDGSHPHRRQHGDRARLRLRGRDRGAWYPITPSTSLMDAFKRLLRAATARTPRPARTTTPSCRPRTSWPPSAW